MKAYILSIAGAVLLSAVVTVIAPSGKTGAFIKGTLKLLILTVMLAPMIGWVQGKEFQMQSSRFERDEGYYTACVEILSESDAAQISAFLRQEFSVEAEVVTQREPKEGFALKNICVNITDFGIIGQDAHIDMIGKIQRALEKKYGCPTEVF